MKNNRIEREILQENKDKSPPYTLLNHDQSVMIPIDYHLNDNDYEYEVQVGCFPDTQCGRRSKFLFTVFLAIILITLGLIALVLMYNFFSCFAGVNISPSNLQ